LVGKNKKYIQKEMIWDVFMNSIKTIRTEQQNEDYFINKWSNYFKSINCYGYLGHTHNTVNYTNFKTISAACDGYFEYISDSEGKILLIADMHLGLDENNLIFQEKILPELKKKDYNIVIFCGDTFECALCDDKDILSVRKFWDWLITIDRKVIILFGNHDINISEEKNSIRKQILFYNKNISIQRTYQIKVWLLHTVMNLTRMSNDLVDFI